MWGNTPNNDPAQPADYPAKGGAFPHWSIAVQQLEGMRKYLDGVGYANTPIWITEIAIHVAYDGYTFDPFPTNIKPVGEYHWDFMSDYINPTFPRSAAWVRRNPVRVLPI